MRIKSIVSGLMLAGMLVSGAATAVPLYNITNLGTLGGTESYGRGINDSGQVVGFAFSANNTGLRGFSYQNGAMTDYGSGVIAWAISNNGQVTGSNASGHAYKLNNGTIQDIGTLDGGTYSHGYGINNAGQIAGLANNANNFQRAFIYSNGLMTDVGTLGGNQSAAFDINSSGQFVGWAYLANNINNHAFLYSNGAMVDLGTLGGKNSIASGINDSGQIVGSSETFSQTLAFLYSNGSMTALGTLAGMTYSHASDINSKGQIVGVSGIGGTYTHHAFLFSDNTMFDLNNLIDPTLGWEIREAHSINSHGDIAATGYKEGVGLRGLLLSNTAFNAIPEPGTLILSALGLVGLGLSRRKQKQVSHD